MQHLDAHSKHRTDEILLVGCVVGVLFFFCIPLSGIDLINLQCFQRLFKKKKIINKVLRKLAHRCELTPVPAQK